MTHHPSNPPLVHLHRFAVPCPTHGQHVYYLGGMDHAADDAAHHLLTTLRRNGYSPEYDGSVIDVATLKSALFDKDLEYVDPDF